MTALSVAVFFPLAVAVLLLMLRRPRARAVMWAWVGATALDLVLVAALWVGYVFGDAAGDGFGYEASSRWIPSVGVGYHIGVDGISLPLLTMTAVLFLACAIYSVHAVPRRRAREYAVLFLFLQSVSLGLFVSLDLILFFVFFDLSIVGMYAVIAGWGHGQAGRSALQFFLYTFTGSLALLLGFIVLYLGSQPRTFDMVELARQQPLAGTGLAGGLALLAVGVGLAVKTPTVPVHTWLPPAHTDAPAAGSAILAGVLLKMGAYGFVRIAMPLLPGAWRDYAWVIVVVGVVSVLYGALVALAQPGFKRMVAYTSVNHMGYIVLGLGAVGVAGSDAADAEAATLAVTGSVVQMVSHGLLTGALFLLSGVLYERGGTYAMGAYGGVAGLTPRFAAVTAVAALGALGLPGLSGFIAEFQIFTGSFGAVPVAVALALPGIVITAALFLRALRRIFLGDRALPAGARMVDLSRPEMASIVPLLALSVLIGVVPIVLVEIVVPAAQAVVAAVTT
ncbi:complex I subunit 4 family protein [Salinactinospora qingdaonensis]